MRQLTPWQMGPFELLLHAELHFRSPEDFDRRMALINFDNAIEVAISTYLSIKPIHRGNLSYKQDDVDAWLKNFHTRLDFLEAEAARCQVTMLWDRAMLVYYHDIRNALYHHGGATVPQRKDIEDIRDAALWVFEFLFDVSNSSELLDREIISRSNDDLPDRSLDDDELIDGEVGIIDLAGREYNASEVLFAVDPVLYSEIANDIRSRFVVPSRTSIARIG